MYTHKNKDALLMVVGVQVLVVLVDYNYVQRNSKIDNEIRYM